MHTTLLEPMHDEILDRIACDIDSQVCLLHRITLGPPDSSKNIHTCLVLLGVEQKAEDGICK